MTKQWLEPSKKPSISTRLYECFTVSSTKSRQCIDSRSSHQFSAFIKSALEWLSRVFKFWYQNISRSWNIVNTKFYCIILIQTTGYWRCRDLPISNVPVPYSLSLYPRIPVKFGWACQSTRTCCANMYAEKHILQPHSYNDNDMLQHVSPRQTSTPNSMHQSLMRLEPILNSLQELAQDL